MAKFKVDTDLIHQLAALLEETGLSEIELGEGTRRVRVARGGGAPSSPAPNESAPPAEADPAPAPAVDASHPGAVISPMVGIVHVAPEPGAPPYVVVGDTVSEGQTLCIVEAMKYPNAISAPRAGTVARILIRDGDPVEYGEVLMILD